MFSFKIFCEEHIPLPDIMELFHGTAMENIPYIMQQGIIPRSNPAIFEQTLQEFASYFSISPEQIMKTDMGYFAQQRFNESKGKVVYLSAVKEYAIKNAAAGNEWKYFLFDAAWRAKYRRSPYRAGNLLSKALLPRKTLKVHFGPLSLLTIQIPFSVFLTKVGPGMRSRIQEVKDAYIRFQQGETDQRKNMFGYFAEREKNLQISLKDSLMEMVFREVHLDYVEPKYIIKQEEITTLPEHLRDLR